MLTADIFVSSDQLRQILATALSAEGQHVASSEIEFHAGSPDPSLGSDQAEARYPAVLSDGMGTAVANDQHMRALIRAVFEKAGYKIADDVIYIGFRNEPALPPSQQGYASITIEVDLKLKV